MRIVNLTKTGLNIKRLREENGISVQELQETLFLSSKQAVYKWQWGQSLPDIQNLVMMADLFHCKVDDILVMDDIR